MLFVWGVVLGKSGTGFETTNIAKNRPGMPPNGYADIGLIETCPSIESWPTTVLASCRSDDHTSMPMRISGVCSTPPPNSAPVWMPGYAPIQSTESGPNLVRGGATADCICLANSADSASYRSDAISRLIPSMPGKLEDISMRLAGLRYRGWICASSSIERNLASSASLFAFAILTRASSSLIDVICSCVPERSLDILETFLWAKNAAIPNTAVASPSPSTQLFQRSTRPASSPAFAVKDSSSDVFGNVGFSIVGMLYVSFGIYVWQDIRKENRNRRKPR